MIDLSVIIPARNEEWLNQTIGSILGNSVLSTEVIVVVDGYKPEKAIKEDKRIKVIDHNVSIGQRASINEGVRLSNARHIMKLDAHCSLDKGFDAKLINDIKPDWTMVPRMYNLHVFDWRCKLCGKRWYMGPQPIKCENSNCDGREFEKVLVWEPRWSRQSDFMRFDKNLHFQYWKEYKHRPEAQGQICDLMCCIGACWMMTRERFWELDGMDEGHGSWGQMGVELACKSWLSGGKQVVNKNTWFAHMFRTQPGFGFPYPNPGTKAVVYSQDMWINNKWGKAKYPLSWLIDKFSPIPDWHP